MDLKLKLQAEQQGGVIIRRQAIDAGMSDDEISRHIRNKTWLPIRRGAYIPAETWRDLGPDGRHRAKAHAVALQLRVPFTFSHVSAAAFHDLPLWNIDLDTVHITRRLGASTRRQADVWHHLCSIDDDELTEASGVPVTSVTRTVIDTARIADYASAVAIADAALHAGKTTSGQLLDRLNRIRDWPGARTAGSVVAFADGRAASVGETWARIVMDAVELPRPELQAMLPTGDRVGFLFGEYRTVVEFDGRHRYGRLLDPGAEPDDFVWREKRREDRIRSHGYQVVRLVWSDLHNPAVVAGRIRRAFDESDARVVA